MAKVRFHADTGGHTVKISHNVRIVQGDNEFEESTIRTLGIDKFNRSNGSVTVTMPPDWVSEEPMMVTRALAPQVEVTDEKPAEFESVTGDAPADPPVEETPAPVEEKDSTEGQNVLGDRMKAEQSKIDSRLHTPAHIAAMDVERAKQIISTLNDSKTLIETISMSNKKTVKEACKKRLREVDPENIFAK